MEFYDSKTGFFIANPESDPLQLPLPNRKELLHTYGPLILSASGWRKIFCKNGKEESFSPLLSNADTLLVGIMALNYVHFLHSFDKHGLSFKNHSIAIGMDTRPTGPAIADIICRVLISQDISVEHFFIIPAPEIMAVVQQTPHLTGLIYISASHNPIGHNGIKYGLSNGAVLDGKNAQQLIHSFQTLIDKQSIIEETAEAIHWDADNRLTYLDNYSHILGKIDTNKQNSYDRYLRFCRETAAGKGNDKSKRLFFTQMLDESKNYPIGIVAEMNGSARTLSIDSEYFTSLGAKFLSINNKAREIVHEIIPEGRNLEQCRLELEQIHKQNPAFLLGYVPDNDGDRGNLVYIDPEKMQSSILQAQQVFGLAVLGELTFAASFLKQKPLAIVCNGPTSRRIDEIAETLDAKVFRAEVGEANVVALAEEIRKQGYYVPILGEGSNGGAITYPAKVRDPINTITALLKLYLIRDQDLNENLELISQIAPAQGLEYNKRPGLFNFWCTRKNNNRQQSEQSNKQSILTRNIHSKFSFIDILQSLPVYTTTGTAEKRSILQIKTKDHGVLKHRYETLFTGQWQEKRTFLGHEFNIHSWQEIQYEGTQEKIGMGPQFRSGAQKGGLKILFFNDKKQATDFIWMRGSGTEPVFRIMADVKGDDPEREAWLLNWQRSMLLAADSGPINSSQ